MRVADLSKKYRIGRSIHPYGRLTESLWDAIRLPLNRKRRRPDDQFWALRDVSLEVGEGEVVGVIGSNGAGKTTLLKILSRITEPTEGVVELHGRVASLLEVGTGFHPELTGRENIFLNGAILGMRRAETRRKFDEIVAFSEVGRFLDTPVKRYSSGMHVRLGFAVAAHLDPDILIVDEVLSVGDVAFQRRCLGKLGEVSQEGRTVLFVSHNMAAVEKLCTRAYLLEGGQVVFGGTVQETVQRHLKEATLEMPLSLVDRVDRKGNGGLRLVEFIPDMVCGQPGSMAFRYKTKGSPRNIVFSMGIFTLSGDGVLNLGNHLTGNEFVDLPPSGVVVCRFKRVPLLPGTYRFNICCFVDGVVADWITDAGRLQVQAGDFFVNGQKPLPGHGSVAVDHRWAIEGG